MLKGMYVHVKGKNTCVKGKYVHVKGKNVCVKGKYVHVKGKNVCLKGKYVYAKSKNVCEKGKNMHAEGGWPTKQFLHMLLGIGHSGAGHHKARVRIVAALTQPAKPPQDKGSVATKHSPAQQPSRRQAANHAVPQAWYPRGVVHVGCVGNSPELMESRAGAASQSEHADGRCTGGNIDSKKHRQAGRQEGRQAGRQAEMLIWQLTCMHGLHQPQHT